MGLSASQGRMLSLTSRLSDLEYRAQNIQNQKIRLADQSEAVSKNYLDALNAKKLTVKNPTTSTQVDATMKQIYELNAEPLNGTKRLLVNKNGEIVVPSSYLNADKTLNDTGKKYVQTSVTDKDEGAQKAYNPSSLTNTYNASGTNTYVGIPADKAGDVTYLYEQLEAGNLFFVEYNEHGGTNSAGGWEEISFTSGDAQLAVKDDEYELAKAEAEYEVAMNQIQAKDKRFDLELQTINTEHDAIQTEMDSVTKVMDKNIERTFKIFG